MCLSITQKKIDIKTNREIGWIGALTVLIQRGRRGSVVPSAFAAVASFPQSLLFVFGLVTLRGCGPMDYPADTLMISREKSLLQEVTT